MDGFGVASMTAAERLAAVRTEIARQGLAGFLVPRSDEHLGEYVPPDAERLAWLTGFTGSAGLAVVLADHAAVWSDGRYALQIISQTDGTLWERLHLTDQPPAAWIAAHIGTGVLGYDPWLMSEDGLRAYEDAGIAVMPVSSNPVEAAWVDRPAPPNARARPHALKFAGVSAEEKRDRIAAMLRAQKQDAVILTDPASIAWLLNIRGGDVEFTPMALGFAVLHADGAVELFMEEAKLPPETRAWGVDSPGGEARSPGQDRQRGLVRHAAARGRGGDHRGTGSVPGAEIVQESRGAKRRTGGAGT
jgi:Xaa-Pro aminopeptidase